MKEISSDGVEKLKKILNQVFEDDQKYRKVSRKLLDQYGQNSKEVQEIIEKTAILDKKNLERIEIILEQYGWLSKDIIGFKESEAIFLVIQHASLDTQIKYFPIMEKAVELGNARKCDLAMLQDRILVKQGKKQIYGTQLIYNEELGQYVVEPLVYPEKVDERRETVGLPPMKEYLESYDLTWTDGEFKKKQEIKMENDVKELIKDIEEQIVQVKKELESPNNPSKRLKRDIDKKLNNYKSKNDEDIKELVTYIDSKVKGTNK